MKQDYLNKITKIFIRPTQRNRIRFARNLYYVKSLSEELNFNDYARMTGIVHTFINTVDADHVKDSFLQGNAAAFFSSIYILRVNLAQVRFARGRLLQLEEEGSKGSDDYNGVKCLLEYREASCAYIYSTKIVPVLKLIIEFLENSNEALDKLTDRVNIEIRNAR